MAAHRRSSPGRHRLSDSATPLWRAEEQPSYWCTRTAVLLSLFVLAVVGVGSFGFQVAAADPAVSLVSDTGPAVGVGTCFR